MCASKVSKVLPDGYSRAERIPDKSIKSTVPIPCTGNGWLNAFAVAAAIGASLNALLHGLVSAEAFSCSWVDAAVIKEISNNILLLAGKISGKGILAAVAVPRADYRCGDALAVTASCRAGLNNP